MELFDSCAPTTWYGPSIYLCTGLLGPGFLAMDGHGVMGWVLYSNGLMMTVYIHWNREPGTGVSGWPVDDYLDGCYAERPSSPIRRTFLGGLFGSGVWVVSAVVPCLFRE
jgi:hypothetical protein